MAQWLVLDIGNTHTVGGLYEVNSSLGLNSALAEARLLRRARFRTDPHDATSDEYRSLLTQLFTPDFWNQTQRLIVASVVPPLMEVIDEMCKSRTPALSCLFINTETRREFDLDLPVPSQLGADRLANVAGALCLSQPPFVIVDAGTATTFCLIDSRPAYIGGAIVPGLEVSWKALQSRAAKLFSVELRRPESTIGNTTETQIQSGILQGYETLIEGMTDRLLRDWKKHMNASTLNAPTLFATGGCIQHLKLSSRFRIEPDLTLLGLMRYGLLTL